MSSDPFTVLFTHVMQYVLNSWVSFVVYVVVILGLCYARYVQLQTRKLRKLHYQKKAEKLEQINTLLNTQNQYIVELEEQQDALLDLVQTTQEHLDVLKLNGSIDKELLDLIYRATTENNNDVQENQ